MGENLPPVGVGLDSPADSLANLSEQSLTTITPRALVERPSSGRFRNLESPSDAASSHAPKPPLHSNTGNSAYASDIRPKVHSRKSSSHGKPLRPSSANSTGSSSGKPRVLSGRSRVEHNSSNSMRDRGAPEGWGNNPSRMPASPPVSSSRAAMLTYSSSRPTTKGRQPSGRRTAPSSSENNLVNSPRFSNNRLWQPKQRLQSGRRGRLLGEESYGGRPGFDTSTKNVNMPEYSALHDNNLSGHFEKPHVQANLKQVGLLDDNGNIVEVNDWRSRMVRHQIQVERDEEKVSKNVNNSQEIRQMILKQRQYADEQNRRMKVVTERKAEAEHRRRKRKEKLEKLQLSPVSPGSQRRQKVHKESPVSTIALSPDGSPLTPSNAFNERPVIDNSPVPFSTSPPKEPPSPLQNESEAPTPLPEI